MSIVFDATSIGSRRHELFGDGAEKPSVHVRNDIHGTSYRHCGICPLPDAEPCGKPCSTTRDELEKQDGIKVR